MVRRGAHLPDVLLRGQKALQLHEDLAHRHGAGGTAISQRRGRGLPAKGAPQATRAPSVARATATAAPCPRALRCLCRWGPPRPSARRKPGCPPRCLPGSALGGRGPSGDLTANLAGDSSRRGPLGRGLAEARVRLDGPLTYTLYFTPQHGGGVWFGTREARERGECAAFT